MGTIWLREMIETGRADLHLHTNCSDGWPSPEALVEQAAGKGVLDVIAVTDHDTIEGGLRAAEYASGRAGAPHVIVGEEVSSRDGHILGLFLKKAVKPGMSAAATIRAIHAQGGLAVAAHPFWRTAEQAMGTGKVHGVGWACTREPFDAVEVENSTPGLYLLNQLARRAAEDSDRTQVGGSDAHIADAVGRAVTVFPGRTPAALRLAIEQSTTRAERQPYDAIALLRYGAWALEHRRLRRASA